VSVVRHFSQPPSSYEPRHGSLRADWRAVRTLLPYLWPLGRGDLKVRVVVALLLLVAAKLANVGVPLLYREAVDALAAADAAAGVVSIPFALLVAYGVARVLALAFGELRDAAFAPVAQNAVRTAGLKTFRHLHALSLRFHLDRKTGGISRAVERGIKAIEFALNFVLFSILPTLLEIALVCGVMAWFYGFWYALATFLTVGIYIAWTVLMTEWRIKFRRRMNETDSEAHTRAIDSLLNFETVKYFNNETHEGDRFDRSLRAYEEAAVKSKISLSLLNIGQAVVISSGVTIMMVMAAYGMRAGSMTLGDFVMVNSYLIQLYMPLNFLGFIYSEMKRSMTDMEQMFALDRVEPEITDAPAAAPLRVTAGEVVFDAVSFSYGPDRRILDNVSFRVPAGHTLAIVGPSGSGKTTISRLLFRFYDVNAGRILIDGQDVRAVTQASLRAAIGMVPQDTVLFNDTVYYNIAYGQPGTGRADVERAAMLARIHDFIVSQGRGYAAMVGERGLKLSGGEKQRIAIARTILKRPSILVFDEATSALDTQTEWEIQASLREVSANRTTLVIAHRLSTVVDADEIIVLDHGRVIERGRHDALVRQNGLYAAMWERQREEEKARAILAAAEDDEEEEDEGAIGAATTA